MSYEIDDTQIALIGYGTPISFYDDDRTLQCEIYLASDNTLRVCGDPISGGGGGGSANDTTYVRLDGNNWNLWVPDAGTQHIVGSFNLSTNDYTYKIGGLNVLQVWDTNNIAVGHRFNASATITGDNNILIGDSAGISLTTGHQNIIIGYNSAPILTTGSHNILIGTDTGGGLGGGDDHNVIIGYLAGTVSTIDKAVFIGAWAGQDNVGGTTNTFVGTSSGLQNTSGTDNVYLGSSTGANNLIGDYNTAVGSLAMRGAVGCELNRNTIIGHVAGYNADTGFDDNTFVGDYAGYEVTTGDSNSIYGSNTGRGITTGAENTILGANVVGLAAALSNNIILADGAGNIRLQSDDVGTISTFKGRIVNTTRIVVGASPYAILATDHVIYCDTDGGAIEVDLPAGVEGTHYKIINCGSSGNDLTVDPNGAEQVYGSGAGVAAVLADGEVLDLHYNATEGWW